MKIYKYRSYQRLDFLFDIICNGFVHCSNYKELNDPFEGQFIHIEGGVTFPVTFPPAIPRIERTTKSVNEVYNSKKFKICSFSKTYDDVRLWSYYAEGHKGIAIEFEIPENLYVFYPVSYFPELKEVSVKPLTDDIIKRILSTKTNQ